MEAATPLRKPQVRTVGDRLAIDGLVVADECAVRLVREREERGEDPTAIVADALEIGARVLDREQTGANAEFVRAEFDKVSREVETAFGDRAREVSDQFERKMDEVFGPENGHLSRALERHFSDESSAAVQNRVKALVADVMTRSREELVKQFSARDGQNPLADLKDRTVDALKEAGARQDENLREIAGKMASLEKELQGLRDERDKSEAVAAERERGTAKGRDFEEVVAEALDAIASVQGDDCDAVGDVKGATRKTGDVVVGIEACRGPARGRIVFEVKNSKLSKNEALRQLDRSLDERDADFAVLVVPADEKVPAKMRPLREYNGDKMIVVHDPDEPSAIGLEVAYALARARVLMAGKDDTEVDAGAVRDRVERALTAMEDVRRVKSQLTGATSSIQKSNELLDEMAERVRDYLREIDRLVLEADAAAIEE